MWSLLPNSPQAPECAIRGVTLPRHQQLHGLALYALKTEVESVRWSASSRMHNSSPCTAPDSLLKLVEFQQLPLLPPSPLFSFPRVCGAHPTLSPFCLVRPPCELVTYSRPGSREDPHAQRAVVYHQPLGPHSTTAAADASRLSAQRVRSRSTFGGKGGGAGALARSQWR